LVDARSRPYSRHVPHFNSPVLSTGLPQHGVQYVFMGGELGGRPPEGSFYDREGHVLYSALARSPRFQGGIRRLKAMASDRRIALLCSEEYPSLCHRSLLIGRVLRHDGWTVLHIRASGKVVPAADIDGHEQPSMFEEPSTWRSIRSVLPADQRNRSFSR